MSRASRLSIVYRDMSGSYRTDSKEFFYTPLCFENAVGAGECSFFLFVYFYIFFVLGGCPSMISDEALYGQGSVRKAEDHGGHYLLLCWGTYGGGEGLTLGRKEELRPFINPTLSKPEIIYSVKILLKSYKKIPSKIFFPLNWVQVLRLSLNLFLEQKLVRARLTSSGVWCLNGL